jgi:hypothetical protein
MKCFYFGCVRESGHYFWNPDFSRPKGDGLNPSENLGGAVSPWGYDIDAGEIMPSHLPQGATRLHRKAGWTALAVADYTVDRRPGSKSVFLFDAPDLDEAGAWRLAEEHFPTIMQRLRSVVPA